MALVGTLRTFGAAAPLTSALGLRKYPVFMGLVASCPSAFGAQPSVSVCGIQMVALRLNLTLKSPYAKVRTKIRAHELRHVGWQGLIRARGVTEVHARVSGMLSGAGKTSRKAAMHMPSSCKHGQVLVAQRPSTSLTRLTGRSTRTLPAPSASEALDGRRLTRR